MDLHFQVGPALVASDSDKPMPRADNWQNLMVSEFGGKWLDMARRGLLWSAGSNTALPIPIYSTPTNSPTLWNPSGSGRLLVVAKIGLAMVAGATIPDAGFGILWTYSAGAPPAATGATFATFTQISPFNLVDGSLDTVVRYGQAMTWTAAPTTVQWMDLSQFTLGTAASAGFGKTGIDPDGLIIVPPGTAISVVSSVASATTWMPSFTYANLPMPAQSLK